MTTVVVATTVVVMVALLLTHKAGDARVAMAALIDSRAIPYSEDDPKYAKAIAELAWKLADAMAEEHINRAEPNRRRR